jgi:uncharacterized protein YkwD
VVRCRLLILVVLGLAVGLPAGSAAAADCAGADTPVSAASLASAKAAVLCLVNNERAARGLPVLAANDALALAAQRHTDDMVARDFFEHVAPAPAPWGAGPGERIAGAGYDAWEWAENIAAGYLTPRQVMAGWMASEGHCRNILAPGVAEIGVGVAAVPATLPNQAGGTWTQDFGRRANTAAPSKDTGPQDGCPFNGLAAPTAVPAAPAPVTPAPVTPAPVVTPVVPPAPTTPAPATKPLDAAFATHGGALVIGGHTTLPDGTRVHVVLRRGHHTLRHARARVRHHRFGVRVVLPPRRHGLVLQIRCGTLRLKHTLR